MEARHAVINTSIFHLSIFWWVGSLVISSVYLCVGIQANIRHTETQQNTPQNSFRTAHQATSKCISSSDEVRNEPFINKRKHQTLDLKKTWWCLQNRGVCVSETSLFYQGAFCVALIIPAFNNQTNLLQHTRYREVIREMYRDSFEAFGVCFGNSRSGGDHKSVSITRH